MEFPDVQVLAIERLYLDLDTYKAKADNEGRAVASYSESRDLAGATSVMSFCPHRGQQVWLG